MIITYILYTRMNHECHIEQIHKPQAQTVIQIHTHKFLPISQTIFFIELKHLFDAFDNIKQIILYHSLSFIRIIQEIICFYSLSLFFIHFPSQNIQESIQKYHHYLQFTCSNNKSIKINSTFKRNRL